MGCTVGGKERSQEISVHKLRTESKFPAKPVAVVCFAPGTLSWRADAGQTEAWLSPRLGVCPDKFQMAGREREAGVRGGACPDGWCTVSGMNEPLMERIDDENVGE